MYWGLYVAPSQESEKPDLGLAIAKKLAKRAVDRNRIKRMIRELVWKAQTNTLDKDVVVKLRKQIGRETRGKLRKKEKEVLRSQMVGLI